MRVGTDGVSVMAACRHDTDNVIDARCNREDYWKPSIKNL